MKTQIIPQFLKTEALVRCAGFLAFRVLLCARSPFHQTFINDESRWQLLPAHLYTTHGSCSRTAVCKKKKVAIAMPTRNVLYFVLPVGWMNIDSLKRLCLEWRLD